MFTIRQAVLAALVVVMGANPIITAGNFQRMDSTDSTLEGDSPAVSLPIFRPRFGPFLSEPRFQESRIRALVLSVPQTTAATTVVTPPPVPPVVKPTPKAQPTVAPPASSGVERVVAFALAQVGKPYVWAASGPNSYDCSGLVMTAFRQIGMALPHFTGALISRGRAVSRAGLVRGDIVFPSNHHVGIYLGNNQIVHAPQPGERVKVSTLWAFYAGRRLV